MKHYLFLLLVCSVAISTAQNASISGKIVDSKQNPLPFVTIQIIGSSTGTTSDSDGYSNLQNLDSGHYKLQFTSIGYQRVQREVNLKASQDLNLSVELKEEYNNLSEIVITSNRRVETLDEVTSSVSVLTAQDIAQRAQTSTTMADLISEVPGMALSTNKTSNTGQTLRGRDMLVLIDGIPQSTPLRDGSRDLNTIDPNVIEREEIIKGATDIYGNGSDGGIINYITKKPKTSKRLASSTQLSTEGLL